MIFFLCYGTPFLKGVILKGKNLQSFSFKGKVNTQASLPEQKNRDIMGKTEYTQAVVFFRIFNYSYTVELYLIARTYLVPWKFVLDTGSLSHWG